MKTIDLAANHFEQSHSREEEGEELIELVIALEAMYAPDDKHEYRHRIPLAAATFVGETANDRRNIFTLVRNLYDKRSQLIHGSYDLQELADGTFVTKEELKQLSDVVRRSILRLLVLHFSGTKSRSEFHSKLSDAYLDDGIRSTLLQETSFEQFLAKQ